MNRRNLVCTVFLVNVVWFTLMKLAEISLNVLKNIRLIARKLSLINRLWLNHRNNIYLLFLWAKHAWTYDHRIKWDEANILAFDSHRFSRKMRESIEIEKHNTIGKPLDSTWRALFNVQN